jgi:tRNA(Arg) A34 adenosine deaminase TadA
LIQALSFAEAYALARYFSGDPALGEVAFVQHQNTIHWLVRSRASLVNGAPSSPITDLLQGIFAEYGDHSFFILRNRIYTTRPLTAMCQGMLKLVGKRCQVLDFSQGPEDLSGLGAAPIAKLISDFRLRAVRASMTCFEDLPQSALANDLGHLHFMNLARSLAETARREKNQYQSDRAIAAILVSSQNEILSFGINRSFPDKTRHAEVSLVQSYYRRTGRLLPKGSRLYTTLEPCQMCAGMIWESLEDRMDFKVYFAEHDPGRRAKNTVLQTGSAERLRFARSSDEQNLLISELYGEK